MAESLGAQGDNQLLSIIRSEYWIIEKIRKNEYFRSANLIFFLNTEILCSGREEGITGDFASVTSVYVFVV